jgi:hypothetical protein
MARTATGTSGRCADYVRNIHVRLSELCIVDEDVREFAALLAAECCSAVEPVGATRPGAEQSPAPGQVIVSR